ncbi:hypothetical protein P8452_40335 [Trifolium repens]|nr:hypothetical protein P8452_40335 [Trifolium repens]
MEWQHWGVIDCMEFAIYPFHFGISFAFWGVLAGCGWQKIGAYVNLGSFYVIGVPCAIVLAFFVHMHAMGSSLHLLCRPYFTLFLQFFQTGRNMQGKLKAELSVQLQPARQLLPTLTETESYNLKNFNKFPNQFIVFIMLEFES